MTETGTESGRVDGWISDTIFKNKDCRKEQQAQLSFQSLGYCSGSLTNPEYFVSPNILSVK